MRRASLAQIAALLLFTVTTATGCKDLSPSAPTVKRDRSDALALFTHEGIRSGCGACHGKDRPTTLVGNPPYDHSKGGLGDCATCHLANVGREWAGGSFPHTPTPTSCAECHAPDRPRRIVGEMSHEYEKQTDCAECHAEKAGDTWEGGKFTHDDETSCEDCHGPQRPVGPVGKKAYDHLNGGMGDCVKCHTKHIGERWSGSMFDHTPAVTSCNGCHADNRPRGPVGKDGFDHAIAGQGDCIACHAKAAGDTWKNGTYVHPAGLASCAECHGAQRPVVLVGDGKFDHGPRHGDCAFCHTKDIGVSWKDGHMHHRPTPANCEQCHEAERPEKAKLPDNSGVNDGHFKGTDCLHCHQTPSKATPKYVFNHLTAAGTPVTTCLPCHEARGVKEHGKNVEDCVKCHHDLGFAKWLKPPKKKTFYWPWEKRPSKEAALPATSEE